MWSAAPAPEVEVVPLRGMRRTIAERMVVAKTTVPHYTYVEEVDMSEVVAMRAGTARVLSSTSCSR